MPEMNQDDLYAKTYLGLCAAVGVTIERAYGLLMAGKGLEMFDPRPEHWQIIGETPLPTMEGLVSFVALAEENDHFATIASDLERAATPMAPGFRMRRGMEGFEEHTELIDGFLEWCVEAQQARKRS